jgi:hypothetical protein
MNKYLNDTEYRNLVANMNSPKGTVKSIEPTGEEFKGSEEPKPEPGERYAGMDPRTKIYKNEEEAIDDMKNDLSRQDRYITGYVLHPSDVMMMATFELAYKKKLLKSTLHDHGYITIGTWKGSIDDLMDELDRRGGFIYKLDKPVIAALNKQLLHDVPIVKSVIHDINETINNKKDKLSSSDSDIKTYLKYWESPSNVFRKQPVLFKLYTDFLKTKKTFK